MDLITVLDAVVYLGLALTVGLRARHTGQEALRWLGWFLLTIGLVAVSVSLLTRGSDMFGSIVLLGAMAAYPALLLLFGAALSADPAPLRRLALLVLASEALYVLTTPFVAPDLEAALVADLWGSALVAVLAHVVVVGVLRRQVAATQSSFVRRRATLLGAGLAVLGISLAGGVLASSFTDLSPVVPLVGGGLAAGLLSLATAPPRWLHAALALRDYDDLVAAEEALATGDDPTAAVAALLRGMVRLLGGRAAWFVHRDRVVASVGSPPWDLAALDRDRSGDQVAQQFTGADGEVQWLLTAEDHQSRLGVVTGRDPVLYGLDVADLLPRMTRRIAMALEGRELEAQRRAQARAEQEAEHYRRIAELKDDLLSTINHELRTPLAMVTGALELVRERWEVLPDDQRRTLVERADVNARALSDVVMQVLLLVELRSGAVRPRPAPTSVAELCARAMDGLPGTDRLLLTCDESEVVVDGPMAAQALRQLVANALTHTHGPVNVAATARGDQLQLVVDDAGQGVDEELLAPFERGGHYLHRTSRGLGLGLSLVTASVDLLEGDIRFEHVDGEGTTVTCLLPLAGTAGVPAAAREQQDEQATARA